MRVIELTQGKVAQVDDEDYLALSAHNWFAVQDKNGDFMQDGIIRITADGTVRFLNTPETATLITPETVTRRASNVQPVNRVLRRAFYALRTTYGEKGWVAQFTRLWPCLWQVDLSPAGGPVLPQTWRNRKSAIEAEIVWLNHNFI